MKKRINKKLVLITALILFVSCVTGCLPLLPLACVPMQTCTFTYWLPDDTPEPYTDAPSPSPQATVSPEPALTASPEPTREAFASASPTATPQGGGAASAIALAASHGIPEERLFGQYDLFLRYMDTIDRNPSLGKYKEFVIRAFPALADNAGFLDEEYFFPRLGSLVIREIGPDDYYSGFYYDDENVILVTEEDRRELCFTLYHELMHFFDASIGEEPEECRILQGRILTEEEYEALSAGDRLLSRTTPTVKIYSDFICEAGAELFTAKYFTGCVTSYSDIASFLIGIEYIYGSDAVKAMFFSPDSTVLAAKVLQDTGMDYTELLALNRYLSYMTDPDYYYETEAYSLEDLLIEMYEQRMEGDWREDKRFRYILACVNGVAERGYIESKHADELEKSDFLSYAAYDRFESGLLSGAGVKADINFAPPIPVIDGERFLLCAQGLWRDPETGAVKYGALRFDYDFDNETVVGFDTVECEMP